MKRYLAIGLMVLIIASLLSGCGNNTTTPGDDSGSSEIKDTLVMVTVAEADTLDPRRGNSAQNNIPLKLIYDSLFRMTPDGKIEPALAESYEFIDDTHLKINLRKDVKFSNGYDLTAEDVYYCFARTKEDSTSISTMSWLDIENTVVEDPHTIILAMYEPYSPALYVLTGGRTWIGSKQAMEEMGEAAYALKPIGTGAYTLESWETGSQMVFKANPTHWRGKPPTENMILKIVPEAASRVIELETGAADFAFYIEGSDVSRVEELDGYHVEQKDSERYFFVTLSMEEELFKDKRVREALSYAIDKKALVDSTFDGIGKQLTGIYSPIVQGFKDFGDEYMPYDLEKAKALMEEAGYADGFEIELQVNPITIFQKQAEVVQDMWSKINVKVNIVPVALATYEAQNNGQWQASIRDGNATEVSNILIVYEKAFGSRLQPNDDVLDDMLQKLKKIYDEDEKNEYLQEIQQYIYDMRYSIPFAYVPNIYGVSDKLQNLQVSGTPYNLNIADWTVTK